MHRTSFCLVDSHCHLWDGGAGHRSRDLLRVLLAPLPEGLNEQPLHAPQRLMLPARPQVLERACCPVGLVLLLKLPAIAATAHNETKHFNDDRVIVSKRR